MAQKPIAQVITDMVNAGESDEDIDAVVQSMKASPSSPTGQTSGFMPDEDWAKLSGGEKIQNVLKWGGKAIGGAFLGPGASEAVENPKTFLASAAIPLSGKKLVGLIPRTSHASAKFQDVMGAAKNVPVDVEDAGQVALRIEQLANRGGSMPKAARDLLRRVTDPERPPVDYGEIRDFASNISRISADESRRLTPVIRREMGQLSNAVNTSAQKAADQAGKGAEHASAMREYARAMRLRDAGDAVKTGVKKALPYAGATGGTFWLLKKLMGGISE